ncbi:LpxI family protein, partial [Alphaproteobacteria bacterium]|nr:LpxI family protein [Alphaproteobacteria bacterium]
FPLFDWINECPELFAREEYLTNMKPGKEAVLNCNKGLEVFKIIGNADIGQSMIVQNQIILGVEAAEGTDELIKRCFNYLKDGDPGILIKLSKYNQNPYLDIPTIGIQTLKNLKKYNYEGIFLEKGKCLILDKEELINFCNLNKIFISTILKS